MSSRTYNGQMKCGALLLCCASLFSQICGQSFEVPVLRPASATSFSLLVANGSDVTVQAQCGNGTWSGVRVVSVLEQYGPTQVNGLLSTFPANQLNFASLNCTAGQQSSVVRFNTVNTFFFDRLPNSSFASNLTDLCKGSVPSIPGANVSVSFQRNYGYCVADTQRGRFRSSSIQIPDFLVQPQNVSVDENTTAVSLSCAVNPGASAKTIQWYYQASSTVTAELLTQSSTVVFESVIPGASVLVLYNQSVSLRPGLYHCQVILTDRAVLNSTLASIDSTSFIPPSPATSTNYSQQIAFGESAFFNYVPGEVPLLCSNYGNLAINITNFTVYIILPPIGKQMVNCSGFTIDLAVQAPLGFTQPLDYERVVSLGTSISLQCVANSTDGVVIQWLKDMVDVGTGNFLNISNVQKNNSGIYQCLIKPSSNSQLAVVSSTYLNVYFSAKPIITILNGSSLLNLSDPTTTPPNLTLLCTVDAHPPPTILWKRGPTLTNGTVQMLAGYMMPSSSQLDVPTSNLSYLETFECVTFQTNLTASVNITTFASPNITSLTPAGGVAVTTEGSMVVLTCEAVGKPLPTLTWVGSVSVENTTSVTMVMGGTRSMVAFNATRQMNGTQLTCQASGRGVASQSVLLQVKARPGAIPGIPTVTPSPTSANVSWTPVDAFPPVSVYRINVTQLAFDLLYPENSTMYNATGTSFLVPYLLPSRSYTIVVTPFNEIGGGPFAEMNFTTPEAAPGEAPQGITISVTEVKKITVSWTAPPRPSQNGAITAYVVKWSPWLPGNTYDVTNTTYTITGLMSGVLYQIQVAAKTRAGVGVYATVNASTFLEFDNTKNALSRGATAPTTTTTITITITLPTGLAKFSHFWIMVMRVNNSLANQIGAGSLQPFSSNVSFVNYSSSLPVGAPYVAAELPGDSPSSFNYTLGDETQQNDAPLVHPNRGLMPGTMYTVFVWGFFNLMSGPSPKRQASSVLRQYKFFSSSEYLAPVSTLPAATTSEVGSIVGGVVGGVVGLLVVLVLVVVVVVYLLMQRHNSHKGYSLPPRKGSIRLPETSVVKPRSLPLPFNDLVLENQHLPLIVGEFSNHVRQLHANSDHLFSEEYELFTIKSPNLPHVVSCLPCNISKNRYANINSFDDTRVVLSPNLGIEGSDYINANYIDGFQRKHAYIATQGPLPSTTYDFWKMVWEQNSCCIIMLTNLVEKTRAKCHQYWPEVGSIILEDLVITLVETQELAYYTVRTFQMKKEQESYEVKQFHYTGWPDFGVPEMPHPLIAFIRRLENFKRTTDGPDIIHCSAGVGRTGTLIAIQELIKMANTEHKVDVFNFALDLRKQRSYMIQTEHQYIFIHDTLLEVIRTGYTQTPSRQLHNKYRELQEVLREFEHIQELQVNKPSQHASAKLPANLLKNRNMAVLPYDIHRVRLLMQPGVNGSDYINASFVDGYERKQQYILAQGPLRNTVDDFWRMIWEHRVYTVVMLCCLEENNIEQCVQYWPTENVKQYGDLFVQMNKENNQTSSIIVREITVTNTKIDESRSLKLYQYTEWEESGCPADCSHLLNLIATVHKPQQYRNGPIVIHDGSSLGRAGSFAVIAASLEQLKAEGVVDIMFTLLSMRQQVSGIVPTEDYYKFCYKALVEYLNSFQQYSNFD